MRVVKLKQIALRGGGGLIPGVVHSQAGWGTEQPGLVEDPLFIAGGVGTRSSLRVLPNQTVL